MSIQLEYVYGPGSVGSDSVTIYEKRGPKLTDLLTVYSRDRTGKGKNDANDAAECLCLLLGAGVDTDRLRVLLAPETTEA